MADKKISALTAATTPLAGTEVLPIVQSGTTKKVSVADLTAGRDTSVAKLTATDNIVISTSGKGIDFSATAGTGTSELLADYEEGTWTPSLGGTATYLAQNGRYTKIGRLVFIRCTIYVNAIGTGSTTTITGVPFTGIDSNPISIQIGGSAVTFSGVYAYQTGTSITLTYNDAAAASNQTTLGAFANLTYVDIAGCFSV
ncbi:MAG: hypothetical protein EBR82_52045 [Caulobacteraceae bacterium]|nr:hypothetical protein [Caulobacteraceae bacterium]NDD85387.1 hypothetical protein [bacterium]